MHRLTDIHSCIDLQIFIHSYILIYAYTYIYSFMHILPIVLILHVLYVQFMFSGLIHLVRLYHISPRIKSILCIFICHSLLPSFRPPRCRWLPDPGTPRSRKDRGRHQLETCRGEVLAGERSGATVRGWGWRGGSGQGGSQWSITSHSCSAKHSQSINTFIYIYLCLRFMCLCTGGVI